MLLVGKQNNQITEISQRLRGLTTEILKGLTPEKEVLKFQDCDDVFSNLPQTQLFQLKSGKLQCRRERKIVYIAEEGDLIGLTRSLKLPEGPFACEGPVELLPFKRDQLVHHVNSSEALQKHWAFYLLCRSSFFSESLSQEIRPQFKPATGFLHFDKGETIIRQGDQADCVYTLLEGSADAYRDEVKVGEIQAEEIFGAMAVFTHQPRSATVIATSHCSVLAVKKDEFIDLVADQPQVCRSLIEEMAAKIDQLNRQIASV